MSRKRRKKRVPSRRSGPSRGGPGGILVVTAEGDEVVFTKVRYGHVAAEEIRQILKQADDFYLDDDEVPAAGGALSLAWLETRSGVRRLFKFLGQRVLADLTLGPRSLIVETMSPQRMDACCSRLEALLGDRIRRAKTK